MNLREKALEEVAQAKKQISRDALSAFREIFGEEPAKVEGKYIYHEGMKFTHNYPGAGELGEFGWESFDVQITCQKCGIKEDMGNVTSTLGLGGKIRKFEKQHDCVEAPNPPEESTCEQKVKKLFSFIVREEKASDDYHKRTEKDRGSSDYYLGEKRAYGTMRLWFLKEFSFCKVESTN